MTIPQLRINTSCAHCGRQKRLWGQTRDPGERVAGGAEQQTAQNFEKGTSKFRPFKKPGLVEQELPGLDPRFFF